jgi:REP element-mobilizing transposase RayT
MFEYIWGVLENHKCHLYRLNGVEDHIHILTHLHPTVSLSSLVKDIKVASSKFIKENKLFPGFDGWQDGYSAFTISFSEKERLIEYVKNQEEHHRVESFDDELRRLLKEQNIDFDDRFLL